MTNMIEPELHCPSIDVCAMCGDVYWDTEARGWLWYCSLDVGHDGAHRCIGASW